MDRKSRKHQLRRQRYDGQRMLALCLALCLILSNLNFGSMLAYATEGNKKSFDIGGDVKAVLKDGVLTVRGSVSYTHLDVYKRQEEANAEKPR